MTLGRGECHTNGTRGDDKEGVLANALAVGLAGTEDRRLVFPWWEHGMKEATRCSAEWQIDCEVSS